MAVETALLTEANLPWYTATLYHGLQDCVAPLQEFVHVWTSEEDQHSTLFETYLLITDNGDHARRGELRKDVLLAGWPHGLNNPVEAMVYTTIQELATRAFYQCTAEAVEGEAPELARALRRVAKDETLHFAFYRDVVLAHLEADPSYVVPLAEVMIRFQMPGYILDDFGERSAFLAHQGVFGPDHFYRDVVSVLWSFWRIDEAIARLGGEAAPVRKLLQYRKALIRLAERSSRRETLERSGIAVE